MRIVMFPHEFISQSNSDTNLRVIKNQLIQILNYIKTNPQKRYEQINKLLPKRHPITEIIAELVLYDSANYIINWVNDNINDQQHLVNGRFDFFDKFTGVTNFLKKETKKKIKIMNKKKKTDRKSHKSPSLESKNRRQRDI